MEIPERTLIGLKLILDQFGISVGTPLMVKSDPPDMDRIVGAIALMQLVKPMGYDDFRLINGETGFHVRSTKLGRHISSLMKKSSRGDFVITGRRYEISKACAGIIESILKHTMPPEKVPFTPDQWLFLVGTWAALHECASDQTVVEVLMTDFIEFMPYVDVAEEAVTLIRANSTRNFR